MFKSKRNRHESPLLSASTILILSGFLIGMSVGRAVGEDLSPYVLACGLAGCLAFLSLDLTSTRREVEEVEEEQRLTENRLDKHVMSLSSIGFTLPAVKEELSGLSDDELQQALDSLAEFKLPEESVTT